jgi:hypothetical protein
LISPDHVKAIQDDLARQLGMPTDLIVRTVLAKDVSATGSSIHATDVDLDGMFISTELSGQQVKTRYAEQALLEQLQHEPAVELVDVEYGRIGERSLFLATVRSVRKFSRDEIGQLETAVRERLGDPQLSLVVQFLPSVLGDRFGPILIGWTNAEDAIPGEGEEDPLAKLEGQILTEVARIPDVFPIAVHFNLRDETWRVLVETTGPHAVTPQEVATVQSAFSDRDPPLAINLWHKREAVVTVGGYVAYSAFTKTTLEERVTTLPIIFRKTESE